MAAKPKLTPEERDNAKRVWESDTRKGFGWLIEELGLSIGQEGMRLIAKADGWVKGGKPSLEKQKTKLGKAKKPSLEAKTNIKPKPVKKSVVVNDAEWESVDEDAERLHGNSKYNQDFAELAYELCLVGYDDKGLAEAFNVDERTINRWKHQHDVFRLSLTRGKIIADSKVALASYRSATGEHYLEEDRVIQGLEGQEVVTLRKQLPPDVKAQIWWLKNRQPRLWRDKQEVEVSGKIDQALLQELEQDMMVRIEQARQRQRLVLIERGIITADDD